MADKPSDEPWDSVTALNKIVEILRGLTPQEQRRVHDTVEVFLNIPPRRDEEATGRPQSPQSRGGTMVMK